MSKTSLIRHTQRHLNKAEPTASKDAEQDEESAPLTAEILRLRRAQKRATGADAKIKISREIRACIELKSKLRARLPIRQQRDHEQLPSRAEALDMAKAIIEMAVNSEDQRPETVTWLVELLDRAAPNRTALRASERVV